MAEILPFPLACRLGFVRRQASWYCGQRPNAAEKNLGRQMQAQLEVLTRKGLDGHVAEREVGQLEAAIRGEVWRLIRAQELGS